VGDATVLVGVVDVIVNVSGIVDAALVAPPPPPPPQPAKVKAAPMRSAARTKVRTIQ
jgi:hypothetical protein